MKTLEEELYQILIHPPCDGRLFVLMDEAMEEDPDSARTAWFDATSRLTYTQHDLVRDTILCVNDTCGVFMKNR